MANLHEYIILFLVWLVSTIVIRALFAKTRTKLRLPPSPFALPIIGHLHLLSPIPHQSFHKISNRFGPLIHLYLGSTPCIVASSPEMAKEFLKTQETSFLERPHLAAVDYLSYPSGNFIFAKFGPYWKFVRKLCMSRLLGGQTLGQLAPIRRDEIMRFLNVVLKKANKRERFDVGGELGKLANNIISRMTMRKRCSDDDEDAEEIMRLVKETSEILGRFNLSDTIWFCKSLDLQGFRRICKGIHDKFDAILEKIINDHEEARKEEKGKLGEEEQVKDLLDILLDISEDESSEIRLNKGHIKAFILDIFKAGSDTSSVAIEWALAELINHPNIMNKAREEIDSVVGKTRLVEESDIPNLPYIQAIAKETLRLHPTAPLIFRESSQNCTVAGYHVPEKTRLFINVWAIGRDPKSWEAPLEFKPERFLAEQGSAGKRQLLDVRGQNFQLVPFGSGRRSCPGATLALEVVQTAIVAMIQCFEWKVDGNIVDMEEAPGITLQRAHPLVCVPVPRFFPLPI